MLLERKKFNLFMILPFGGFKNKLNIMNLYEFYLILNTFEALYIINSENILEWDISQFLEWVKVNNSSNYCKKYKTCCLADFLFS